MVLQSVNRQRVGRIPSDVENRKPPSSRPSASGPRVRSRKQRRTQPQQHKLKPKQSAKTHHRVPGSHRTLHDTRRCTSITISPASIVTSAERVVQDWEMTTEAAATQTNVPAARPLNNWVRFQRHLSHPATCYPSDDALAAVGVDARVNLLYTRGVLRSVGHQMWKVIAATRFHVPSLHIPKTVDLVVEDLSGEMPTHALAVWPLAHRHNARSSAPTPVKIYPIHGCIVAVNSAHLPPLPLSPPTKPCTLGSTISVPVVTLGLPHPESFQTLLHYQYTKEYAVLFETLFPVIAPDVTGLSPSDIVRAFGCKIALSCDVATIIRALEHLRGLWQNVCFLGVFDDALWGVLDCSWEILLTAFSVKTGGAVPPSDVHSPPMTVKQEDMSPPLGPTTPTRRSSATPSPRPSEQALEEKYAMLLPRHR